MSENKELSIHAQYKIGFPVFEKLFNTPSAQLKELLKEILSGHMETIDGDYLLSKEGGSVYKESTNDRPTSISISAYGTISISPFGITYKPEHGDSKKLIEFNKYFKLD